MECNMCAALMINGVFCHEIGCPNKSAEWENGEWVKYYDCFECGDSVRQDDVCNCQNVIGEDEETYTCTSCGRKCSAYDGCICQLLCTSALITLIDGWGSDVPLYGWVHTHRNTRGLCGFEEAARPYPHPSQFSLFV